MIELFAADDRLCLAAEKVQNKKVEKSVLWTILEKVAVEGATISGNAHFIVLDAARQIVDAEADYLLALKGNQPTLFAGTENFFDQAHAVEWEGIPQSFHIEVE